MITLLSFAFVLGVLVFVHELGHFLAAKRVGIRVLKFQLGFNPTIAAVRRGDTEYSLGLLPLGGYVKMAGESAEDITHDEHGNIVKRSDEFLSKTRWERFQVLIMGPTMNILLALILSAIVLYQGAEIPAFQDQPPVVGAIAAGAPASKVDIQPGDLIASVDGHKVDTWEQFYIAVGSRPNREIPIGLLRNGLEITRQVTPLTQPSQSRFEIGEIGVLPAVHPHIRAVNAGAPAEKAGLKPNDIVLTVEGETMTFASQLREAIAKRPGQVVKVTVLRDGATEMLEATPCPSSDRRGCDAAPAAGGKSASQGLLGISIADETKSIKPGAVDAVKMSVSKNVEYAGLIVQTLWGLVTRQTSPRQLMGPVAIAQLSGESAQLGWIALFSLMASISLNLGLLNLMPIPVLDGGHIFIMALEGIARRDFSVRLKEKVLMAGFVLLMMLMVTVIYNDLTRISWIGRLMPWR